MQDIRLLQQIGRGASGKVGLAEVQGMEGVVAVKVMARPADDDAESWFFAQSERDALLGGFGHTAGSVASPLPRKSNDVLVTKLFITGHALLRRFDQGLCTCLADDVTARLHYWQRLSMV